MSEKHKQILKKGNAAITEGNNEGFLEFCTEDTEWTFVGERILKGKDAVRSYMAETYIEPPQFNVIDMIAEGDLLSAIGEIIMKDKEGKEVHYQYCDVWRFEGDKLAALKAFVIEAGR